MAAFYVPPQPKNMDLVIPDTPYTPPTVTEIKIDLLILTEPIPITQNSFFLFN